MRMLPLLLFFSLSFTVFAQQEIADFGTIRDWEVELVSVASDPEAKAVVLFDYGQSMFFEPNSGGFDIRFTRHRRIKIFDKSATRHTEVSIPYYRDGYGKSESVVSIEAVTYSFENGKMVKTPVKPANIFVEKLDSRYSIKKFVFPNVQDGSILEYKYVFETPFVYLLPKWKFQDVIPTLYSQYEVRMIPFYEYSFYVQGIQEFYLQSSIKSPRTRRWNGIEYNDYIHTYVLTDVPAFKDEEYITSINDYLIKMEFQLAKTISPQMGTIEHMSTWANLKKKYLKFESFGDYLKSCRRQAQDILKNELILDNIAQHDKSRKIIEYVRSNFVWNGDNASFAQQSAKEFLKYKNGNSAEINLFLIALLNEANIEAEPVILSTRKHGKILVDFPFIEQFNYVIALVKDKNAFLADATTDLIPYNRLPIRCLNDRGLVIDEKQEDNWLDLNYNLPSFEKSNIKLTIDTATFKANARVSIQSTDYNAYLYRNEFNDDSQKIKDYFKEKVGSIDKMKAIGYKKLEMPYSLNFATNVELEHLNKHIVVKPFLNLPVNKNFLTQKERSYPVDFIFPTKEEFLATIDIPEGYKVASVPEAFEIKDDLAEILLRYTLSGSVLRVEGVQYFKKGVYYKEDYAAIKSHMENMIKQFNQPVVFEPMVK